MARRVGIRQTLTAYGFLAPNLIFYAVFLLYPVLAVFVGTFRSGGLLDEPQFVGLTNWRHVFINALTLTSMKNTLYFWVLSVPAMLVLALIIAMFLQNLRSGASAFRALLYLPTLAPVVLAALIWLFLIHPDFGAVNFILRGLGRDPVNWLGDPKFALPALAGIDVWRGIGFWSLYFLASLLALPAELQQAAQLDGAGAWQRFKHVTLPFLRPTLLFAVVLATIYGLQVFDSVFVLTDGAPSNATATMVWYIYKSLFQFDQIGYGSVLSYLLLAVILLLTLPQMRILRQKDLN